MNELGFYQSTNYNFPAEWVEFTKTFSRSSAYEQR